VDLDGAPNKATKGRPKRGPARTNGIVPKGLLSREREKEVPSLLVSRKRSLVLLVTSRARATALNLRVVPDLREVVPRVVAPTALKAADLLLANRSSGGKLVRPLTLLVKVDKSQGPSQKGQGNKSKSKGPESVGKAQASKSKGKGTKDGDKPSKGKATPSSSRPAPEVRSVDACLDAAMLPLDTDSEHDSDEDLTGAWG
jgi:hypothetical protein